MDKQPLVIEQRIRYKLRRFKRAIAAGRLTAGDHASNRGVRTPRMQTPGGCAAACLTFLAGQIDELLI